jgi:hypothetical protein
MKPQIIETFSQNFIASLRNRKSPADAGYSPLHISSFIKIIFLVGLNKSMLMMNAEGAQ